MKTAIALATVAAVATFANAEVDCTQFAIKTQSSYSTTCTGDDQNSNSLHVWPVGVDSTYCHGWEASDQGGNKNKMSANAIKCSDDATIFYYTLYYGVIDCGASTKPNKVEERNYTSTCAKGDDNMYGVTLDMSCCDPRGADFVKCKKSAPSVQFPKNLGNATYYANGAVCSNTTATTAPKTTSSTTKATTTTVAPSTTAAPTTTAKSSASSLIVAGLALVSAAFAL
ncbi:hypothetical protein LEN26_012136 [Aphanomyces euteiches]|nr:hypothetical protein LEN26_012136 [Aphanomyces euteiches]